MGVLEIQGTHFRMTPVPLRTVRPFIMHEVVLEHHAEELRREHADVEARVEELLASVVQELLDGHAQREGGDGDAMLPLVRVRVDHTGYPTLQNQRFGRRFVKRVANPGDLLLFKRRRVTASEWVWG